MRQVSSSWAFADANPVDEDNKAIVRTNIDKEMIRLSIEVQNLAEMKNRWFAQRSCGMSDPCRRPIVSRLEGKRRFLCDRYLPANLRDRKRKSESRCVLAVSRFAFEHSTRSETLPLCKLHFKPVDSEPRDVQDHIPRLFDCADAAFGRLSVYSPVKVFCPWN